MVSIISTDINIIGSKSSTQYIYWEFIYKMIRENKNFPSVSDSLVQKLIGI